MTLAHTVEVDVGSGIGVELLSEVCVNAQEFGCSA